MVLKKCQFCIKHCDYTVFSGVGRSRVCWTRGDQLCQGGGGKKWGGIGAEENINFKTLSINLDHSCVYTCGFPIPLIFGYFPLICFRVSVSISRMSGTATVQGARRQNPNDFLKQVYSKLTDKIDLIEHHDTSRNKKKHADHRATSGCEAQLGGGLQRGLNRIYENQR